MHVAENNYWYTWNFTLTDLYTILKKILYCTILKILKTLYYYTLNKSEFSRSIEQESRIFLWNSNNSIGDPRFPGGSSAPCTIFFFSIFLPPPPPPPRRHHNHLRIHASLTRRQHGKTGCCFLRYRKFCLAQFFRCPCFFSVTNATFSLPPSPPFAFSRSLFPWLFVSVSLGRWSVVVRSARISVVFWKATRDRATSKNRRRSETFSRHSLT